MEVFICIILFFPTVVAFLSSPIPKIFAFIVSFCLPIGPTLQLIGFCPAQILCLLQHLRPAQTLRHLPCQPFFIALFRLRVPSDCEGGKRAVPHLGAPPSGESVPIACFSDPARYYGVNIRFFP